MLKVSDVVSVVTRAWSDDKYTEDIHAALTTDTSHPEDKEARDLFLTHEWHEVPTDVLLAQYPNPFLIGDEALRYYLPAFLICAIKHPDEMLCEYLVEFQLRPPKKAAALKAFCDTYDPLSQEQVLAVIEFLLYCKQTMTYPRTIRRIEDGIERYWQKRALP